MHAPQPVTEKERLSALDQYEIMDTPSDEAFDRITRVASTVFQAPIALVSLVDEDRQWFKSRQGLEAQETPRELAFCAHAIQSNDVMVVEDASIDPRFAENPLVVGNPDIRFYAGAPLRSPQGHNLGTLCVIDREPRRMTAEQTALLRDLAMMVMDEMELRRLASVDPLTGALNRRHFMELAERERQRALRYDTPLSLFMMDIDHFKSINDRYGHATGDTVLKQLIQVSRDTLREPDIISRFGGEEFSVLLPHTDISGALKVAERLRRNISRTAVLSDTQQLNATISLGVSTWHAHTDSLEDVLEKADRAMYEAKHSGRNCVKCADSQ